MKRMVPVFMLAAVVLATSSCANIKLRPKVKSEFGDIPTFAKTVTTHLYDKNYQTYTASQTALTTEMTEAALKKARSLGLAAKNANDIKAQAKTLDKAGAGTVTLTSVDEDAPTEQGFVPVIVKGQLQNGPNSTPINISYMIAVNSKDKKLVVASFERN